MIRKESEKEWKSEEKGRKKERDTEKKLSNAQVVKQISSAIFLPTLHMSAIYSLLQFFARKALFICG